MACMFYFPSCMNIIVNLLLAHLVKYDVHTSRKIKSIHVIFLSKLILLFYTVTRGSGVASFEQNMQPSITSIKFKAAF